MDLARTAWPRHTGRVNLQIVFDVAVIAALTWFWVQRARPTLIALGAEPRALRIGLLATIVAIATLAIHVVADLADANEPLASWGRLVGGFVWIVAVGLGHPEYRFLRHATGTRRPGT